MTVNFGEDNLWTIPNVLTAQKIYVIPDYYPYNYRCNTGSITHSVNKNLWKKFVELDDHIINILTELNAEQLIPQIWCDSVFHAAISINNIIRSDDKYKQKIKQIKEIMQDKRVEKGLRYMKPAFCSSSVRFYLWLMKCKAYRIVYVIKSIQKRK